MLLQGKVAAITGGSRGIGFAIAQKFLENGATVVLFGSRPETADKAVAELKALNADWNVAGMSPNLEDAAAVDAALCQIKETYGSLDILVNNAGISQRAPLYDYDPADLEKIMNLNVLSLLYSSQSAA